MKVEFTSNPAAPWGQFTISPEDIKETALLNVMFGTASVVRVPMGITGFKQGADGNVESFSVGFVIPQQQPQQPGQLTEAAKDAIAAQDVQQGAGVVLADPAPAGDTPPQSPPEQT